MATKPSLDDRLSRMEAIQAREADATEGEYSLRILRGWSTPDLKRLEGLLERVEAGDQSAALTAAEQEWIDETMEQARRIVGAPRDLTRRLLKLEADDTSETADGGKLDLGFLTKEERGRLRTILLRVKDLPSIEARKKALTTAEHAWLMKLGNRVEAADG